MMEPREKSTLRPKRLIRMRPMIYTTIVGNCRVIEIWCIQYFEQSIKVALGEQSWVCMHITITVSMVYVDTHVHAHMPLKDLDRGIYGPN